MSYDNGGPFGSGSPAGGQRAYPQSYNDPSFSPGQQPGGSGNRTLFLILGIVSAITVLGALVCCGLGYFGVQMVGTELARQYQPQIQNSPEIVEHIGEIQEMALDLQGAQRAGEPGAMVFSVRGTKGSGQIVVDPGQAARAPDEAFELILPDGRRLPITEVARDRRLDPRAAEMTDDLPPDDDDLPPNDGDLPPDAEAESLDVDSPPENDPFR